MNTITTRRRFAMLTDCDRQMHEAIDLPVTSILFDRRTGAIHKMGVPQEMTRWTARFRENLELPSMGVTSRLAQDATLITAEFTPDEIDRFTNEPRSILRDMRVRALPTAPTWHECRVEAVKGVVPAAEAHMAWTSFLDGKPFGRHETHEEAEQALMDECAAVAPLKPRI